MRVVDAVARAIPVFALVFASASCSDSSSGPVSPALTNSIVFVSDRSGSSQIHVMNGDGTVISQLTTIEGVKSWPAISPSGRTIAFTNGDTTVDGSGDIFVVNSDGTELKQLTMSAGSNRKPTWSSDGSQIAFSSTRMGKLDIFVMNADGSGQTNITNNVSFDFDAAWQPHANRILFVSNAFDPGTSLERIVSMTSTGDSLVPLVYGVQPEWSPSGTKFLFKTATDIWISVTADGSSTRLLVSDSSRHFTPTWSPDETRLAFSRVANDREELWTMSAADGGDEHRLTADDQGNNSYPTWTRH